MGDGEASYVRPDNAASTSQSVLQETTQPSTNASDGLSDQRHAGPDAAENKGSVPPRRVPHLDIANYPSVELLRMLAALLQHIATSNDQLRPLSRTRAQEQASGSLWRGRSSPNSLNPYMSLPLNDPRRPATTTAALSALSAPSSTLCFHARNIPAISIEAYLLRILKYCPTSNDVFLSLLVYFDRMSRLGASGHFPGDPAPGDMQRSGHMPSAEASPMHGPDEEESGAERVPFPGMRGFAIDSYNVHRLVIAGITVASKFFSDVFYTNARYAKVGGLALHELNQLELHFLLLNDFRLTIPVSEIQQYGDQLLAYASDRAAAGSVPHAPYPPDERKPESQQQVSTAPAE